jgi:kynurenine formamidase
MRRLVDLTLLLSDGTATYPHGPKIHITDRLTHAWTKGRYIPPAVSGADRIWMLNEHIGTHVDSPYHFVEQGKKMHEIPLDRFCGTAILADVSALRAPHEPVTVAHVEAALAARDETARPDDILLVRTWPGERGAPGYDRAKALAPSVGAWAVGMRLKAVGIDLANIDHPTDRSFPVHMHLLPNDILIYENLANLEDVPAGRFTFYGLPLRVAGATGSAIRAVAVIE